MIYDSKTPLLLLNNSFNTRISTEEDTFAEFILSEVEHLADVGDTLEHSDLTFEIIEAEDKEINKLKITKYKRRINRLT